MLPALGQSVGKCCGKGCESTDFRWICAENPDARNDGDDYFSQALRAAVCCSTFAALAAFFSFGVFPTFLVSRDELFSLFAMLHPSGKVNLPGPSIRRGCTVRFAAVGLQGETGCEYRGGSAGGGGCVGL
jgi:hypothetical protein